MINTVKIKFIYFDGKFAVDFKTWELRKTLFDNEENIKVYISNPINNVLNILLTNIEFNESASFKNY